jgi:predicted unusual protein kinase regulating ubiquinone biosynthesis (AarF/ABC1/UbiB family)
VVNVSRRALVPVVGLAALVAAVAGAVAAIKLQDDRRRTRLVRTARVWWLTGSRAAHFAAVKVRGAAADEARRAELEERFAIRTAEDVARELGNMKGAIMKAGQLIGFIAEGLPPQAQEALASLQADVPPMSPGLARGVIRDELGAEPEELFLDWEEEPVAAASIGQVHRAVLHDGRRVAVKVQYPGVADAITGDLDNAELLYGMVSALALKNLDVKALVEELRQRMGDELDYRIEAGCQQEFADRYATHPFIKVPGVVPERSARRVLTSEWVDGQTWAEFEASATEDARQQAGEVLFRFAQGSVHLHGVFNGDPHPGNYRFHADGTMTFLDFGLVKRWTPGEFERLDPILDAVMDQDVDLLVKRMVQAGFLAADHGLDPQHVFEYVGNPYVPYLTEQFTFTREFVADALGRMLDVAGPYGDVLNALNMPASFVILDRVVWGVSALEGKPEARNRWRGILQEYRHGGEPVTELGRIEAEWRRAEGIAPRS